MDLRDLTAPEWALEYHKRGLSVFPVGGGGDGKAPLVEWKRYQSAPADADQVAAWFTTEFPNARGIGVATGALSGLVSLDADGPRGVEKLRSFGLPPTATFKSGRAEGGYHALFRHPGEHVGNRTGWFPGLDVKGDGGYIIVPPSLHHTGRRYAWLRDIRTTPLAALPVHVLELLRSPAAVPAAPVGAIPEGQRNDALYRTARGLIARGLSLDAVAGALVGENAARCSPPLPEREVLDIARNAWEQPDRPAYARIVSGSDSNGPLAAAPVEASPAFGVGNVWDAAKTVDELDALGDAEIAWLDYPVIARGHVTKNFAPRGTGKSMDALYRAIRLARTGLRVLYCDRDNSPQLVKKRAVGFGARGVKTFHLMTRKNAPALTQPAEWAKLAQRGLDVLFIDSWDAFTEGGGEASDRAAKAMGLLLDLAREENGPAIVILGNTTKSAAHGRGSGVIGDRLDIEYEIRDITGWSPTGIAPWHEGMPPGGLEFWASRATRRTKRENPTSIRLAFVNTKFRVEGDDPAPFAVEIDSSTEIWTERDVTDELVAAGDEAKAAALAARRAKNDRAAEALKAEILRRAAADEPLILKKQAEALLCGMDLRQRDARRLLDQMAEAVWEFHRLDKKSVAVGLVSNSSKVTAGQMLAGILGVIARLHPDDCGYRGCESHGHFASGDSEVNTTTAFSDNESSVKSRLQEEANAVGRLNIGQPYSGDEIASKDTAPVQVEMRLPLETKDDEGWTTV